jgi:RNA polymerase-binding protein DksA
MAELYEAHVEDQTVTFEPQEIQNYKRKLMAKRNEIQETLRQVKPSVERPAAEADETGDLSSVPFHQADLGTDAFNQELDQRHLDRERLYIAEIDHALEKIENHEYGICERDHRPISKERLEAIPWTRLCIDCGRAVEG